MYSLIQRVLGVFATFIVFQRIGYFYIDSFNKGGLVMNILVTLCFGLCVAVIQGGGYESYFKINKKYAYFSIVFSFIFIAAISGLGYYDISNKISSIAFDVYIAIHVIKHIYEFTYNKK